VSTDCTVLVLLVITERRRHQVIWSAASTDAIDAMAGRFFSPSQNQHHSRIALARPKLRKILNLADARPWISMQGVYRFAGLVAVSVVALVLIEQVLPKPVATPFSQFYFTGAWTQVNSIVEASPSGSLQLSVGITNVTRKQTTYQITVLLDDHASWARRAVTVPAGASWSGPISGRVPDTGCMHLLSLRLTDSSTGSLEGDLTAWVRGAHYDAAACKTTVP
jgi:hypothetical protein